MNGAASSVKWQTVVPTSSFILNDNNSARPVVTIGSMVDRPSPFCTRSRYFNPVAARLPLLPQAASAEQTRLLDRSRRDRGRKARASTAAA